MHSDSLPERLEQADLVVYPSCPFPLPSDADRAFLLEQKLEAEKEILYDPMSAKVTGFRQHSSEQAERLHLLLHNTYTAATNWLAQQLPEYAALWRPDVARLHIEEEVTRRVRFMARNDLLHLDALFSKPTHQYRILRFFVNLNLTDPRVWITSDKVDKLLQQFGALAGAEQAHAETWLERGVLSLFRPNKPALSPYDLFLNRFHRYLKKSEQFQEYGAKHIWKFPPGSSWLVFTDGLSHAELRGRCVLDCTFLIAPESLTRPDQSPAALLQRLVPQAARAA